MSNSILTGKEYLALPRSAETFLVEPLLPQGGSLTLYGDPKVGKSFAALQLANAIVKGKEWLGFPVRQNGPVAYIQLDTPRSLWADRIEKLREAGEDVTSIHIADRETLGTWPFNILEPTHFQILSSALQGMDPFPVAVIIDTLKESHQLDENSNTDAQKVIAALTAATQPAALILVHHSRKESEIPSGLVQGARGAGYLMGKMDAIVKMSKKTMHFTGRAIEEGSFRIARQDSGFFTPANDELERLIDSVLTEPGTTSDHARSLAGKLNKSEEAARSLIRRHQAGRS